MALFTPEQIDILSQTTVRMDLLVKMEFKTETAYVWNGNTELHVGGNVWLPMHGRGQIDGINISSGSEASNVSLSLSGIPDNRLDLLALALDETADADQQLVTIYIQLFDDNWQPVGNPIGIWWGFMQPPRVTRSPMGMADGAVQSVSVTAENAFFNRSRPPYGRYTDRDQQRRHPGDKFFQFTPSLLFKTFTYPDF